MSHPPTPEESGIGELISSIDVRAPESLHERVAALVAEREGQRRRARRPRRLVPAAAFAAVLVAAVITVAVAGLGGGAAPSAPPLVRSAAVLTRGAPTAPAPEENRARRGELLASMEGVAFPYWTATLGWRATGTRSDRVQGRPAETVFYGDGSGRRIGYTIVGGPPLPSPSGGSAAWRAGVEYRLMTIGGAPAVVWLRDGRLCVVSGRGVDDGTLLRLASWNEQGALSA